VRPQSEVVAKLHVLAHTGGSEARLSEENRMSHHHVATRFFLGGLLGVTLALVSQLPEGAGAVGSSGAPHIVAQPNNVMVNTTVKLIGTGFKPHATLDLMECGSTNWIVPQDPCNTSTITVTTNGRGHFVQTFEATLCPRSSSGGGHPVTEERCYVGDPSPSGIDTINLVGHVKIIVTYP
jgi:hypothetical protein